MGRFAYIEYPGHRRGAMMYANLPITIYVGYMGRFAYIAGQERYESSPKCPVARGNRVPPRGAGAIINRPARSPTAIAAAATPHRPRSLCLLTAACGCYESPRPESPRRLRASCAVPSRRYRAPR
jgi:hypothetical protein